MNARRNVGLVVVGMALALVLVVGAGAAFAEGRLGGFAGLGEHVGFMSGGHMHGG